MGWCMKIAMPDKKDQISITKPGKTKVVDKTKKELALELFQKTHSHLPQEDFDFEVTYFLKNSTKPEIIRHIDFYNTYGVFKHTLTPDPTFKTLDEFMIAERKRRSIYGYMNEWQLNGTSERLGKEWNQWIRDTFEFGYIPLEQIDVAKQKLSELLDEVEKLCEPKDIVIVEHAPSYYFVYKKDGDKERYVSQYSGCSVDVVKEKMREYFKIKNLIIRRDMPIGFK